MFCLEIGNKNLIL